MKKMFGMLGVFIFLMGCGQAAESNRAVSGAAPAKIAWMHDFELAKSQAAAANKPLMLDFYADWCGWCKRMDKDTFAHADVAGRSEKFICVKINGDNQRQLMQQFGVQGFPTTVFLRPDGTRIETVPGYVPAQQFVRVMDEVLSKMQQ
ncbi:MAG: thioredoxin family protein [Candidatus Omnitrophica bacterium]|nr:thioredoxin family protein [Candidatus Omnitrophota bacterium]